MGILSSIFGPPVDPIKDINDNIKIQESQLQFNSAASDTIELTKQVTQSLRDKLSDYANQIESMSHMMSDALLITDSIGTVTNTNEMTCDLFEKKEDDILGKSVVSLFNLHGCCSFEDFIKASINTSKDIHADFQVTTLSGKEVYTDVSVACVIKSDSSQYYIIVIRDITERIMDMRNVYESEQRFKSLTEASMESFVIHNGQEILDCNQQFLTLTGFEKEQVIGSAPENLIYPTDRDFIHSLEKTGYEGKNEFHLLTSSGSPIMVSVNSRVIHWENKLARINVIHDISIYKDESKVLKNSRERYKNILDNNIDILCCYNSDLTINFINHTFEEYFGVRRTDVVGTSILDFIPTIDHDMFIANVNKITSEENVQRSLYRLTINGQDRWQDWIDRGIFDSEGKLVEYQAVSRDVTSYLNARISSST